MTERLNKLSFVPPETGTSWVGPPRERQRYEIKRAAGSNVRIELPLFWHEPPWHQSRPKTADMLATATASLGVLVSALRRELSGSDDEPTLHSAHTLDNNPSSDDPRRPPLPRIVPYRPERYGLQVEDFDGARVVDLRLAIHRESTGRYAYSGDQIARWEATPEEAPLAGGSWVPAASFLPDVPGLDRLGGKVKQIRTLAPEAAVFVTIDPHRMAEEISHVVAAEPDGLILRFDTLDLDGLELAVMTRQARRLLRDAGAGAFPLWIVPGDCSADDAVKLVTLGASGVAIDRWCGEIAAALNQEVKSNPAIRIAGKIQLSDVHTVTQRVLAERVNRFKGLLHSIQSIPDGPRVASHDRQWADALGIPWLAMGRSANGDS